MVKTEKIASLIKGHIDGVLTHDEQLLLQRWVESDPANKIFLERVLEEDDLREGVREWLNLEDRGEAQDWQRRLERNVLVRISPSANRIRPIWRRILPYAAACVIIAALAAGYYFVSVDAPADSVHVVYDVAPGGNKASLTMPDGRKLALSEQKEGIVISNELTYTDGTFLASGEDRENVGFFTISTPVGGQYQITLADGTKVWLNAASSLRYPSRFDDSARVVELEGEGYFEVATVHRDNGKVKSNVTKMPFLVKTKHQTVSVVGTAFNVAAYADEPDTKTTLVEGEVVLTSAGTQMRLLPGEQGISEGYHDIRKQRVDVSEFVAWKQDLFLFNDTELRVAMNQLNRWYDLNIVYEGKIPNTYFYGEISRNKRLSEVLDILRKGGVNFRIERTPEGENKLTVLR